jgi:DNA-binding transcriptional LysR family regulator
MLSDDLVVLKVAQMRLQRNLGMVWHRKRTLSNAAKVMMDLLARARTI